MNRCYRLIFHKGLGQLVAVSEIASGRGGGNGGGGARSRARLVRDLACCLGLAGGLALCLGGGEMLFPALAQARIAADPSAPGNQQPTVLNTANGVPQVNIQPPSAAGVSRNTYSQFDIERQGAILNNRPSWADGCRAIPGWPEAAPG